MDLFHCSTSKIQKRKIWVNQNQLNEPQFMRIKSALSGIFDANQFNTSQVQQYEWLLKDKDYKNLVNQSPKQSMNSPNYSYFMKDAAIISFHFKCYSKY